MEFRDVFFHYPNSPKDVLSHISFRVERGQTLAIIGATGSGKTTLISLIARFYDATGVQVLVDGADVREYAFDALYDRLGYVTQRAVLFSGDVESNVRFGQSAGDPSEEAVYRALDLAQATEFVAKLPQGIHAPIAQGGANVSGGQKQRLSIARAMVQNNPMLILDEATSSVDTRTELITQRAMDQLTQHRTSFVIAHRLSTIRNADLILVLKDGDIIEQGTHEELLARGGFYADLYNSQFEKDA